MTTDPIDLLRRIVAAWEAFDNKFANKNSSAHWDRLDARLEAVMTEARDLLAQPARCVVCDHAPHTRTDQCDCACVPSQPVPTTAQGICDCGAAHRWDLDKQEFVPTHQPVADTLDAAWARMEAALPDEYRFQSVYWHALDGGFTAVVYPIDEEVDDAVRAAAPTPIAALHALADALEARK